jgi:cell wall-associated NlpC family hydrolase
VLVTTSRIRQFQAVLVVGSVALLSAVGASADPGTVAAKEAQAQQVLGQINQIDQSLNSAVEAYNLANVRLHKIRGDLRDNKIELNVAIASLKRSQKELARRLVSAYTSSEQNSTLAVLLGATSLNDLVTRIETINATSKQDTHIVTEVTQAKAAIQRHRAELQHAQSEQQSVVAQKAAEEQHIKSQLAHRRALLSSIRGEIAHIKAVEAARQLQLAAEARARLAADPPGSPPQPVIGVSASTPEGSTVAPPNVHGGVVGIAMRYLGVPYVWGGASPRGFDCSGFVMYVFAQIGIALPHSSYAQFGMGTPVSISELQPGDLVFFAGASHVGIYIGGGQFIHAPHTGDVVKISSLTGWYAAEFAGGRRI